MTVSPIIRIFASAALAALLGGAAVWLTPAVPLKIHSWFLGAGAVLFSISEVFFRNLVSELSSVLRRGSYSLWQMDQLQQVIPLARSNALRLWSLSLVLKALVGFAAVILLWDSLSAQGQRIAIFFGYAALLISFALSAAARTSLKKMESLCDEIVAKEVATKEKRRLRSELAGGSPHDFRKDEALKTYSKPPHQL